ncbi:MAG TPA: gamma-glutamyl-gamma-aminobutyrate hydrolase family protein, partial [Gaiellales bacterium]
GGSDLNPVMYGQEPHPESAGFHDQRDRAELALIREALARDMPVLGICRGMQLLNVALGGDLHQHLGSATHKGPPGRYTFHEVTVAAGTRLADVLGAGTRTHSCHHQAPDRLGTGLRQSARAEDGTVEAVELPAARFALGVLWHPEEDEVRGAPLFGELVTQARTFRRAAA